LHQRQEIILEVLFTDMATRMFCKSGFDGVCEFLGVGIAPLVYVPGVLSDPILERIKVQIVLEIR
jgi:hypothetical protein